MKRLIWSTTVEDGVKHIDALKPYFKITNSSLVDKSGNSVFDLTLSYFYKNIDGNLFPIINNRRWFGDYFDPEGNLVLTQEMKIDLIRGNPFNKKMLSSNGCNDLNLINSILNIAASIVSDYYARIRSFERDNTYYLSKQVFNSGFLEQFNNYCNDQKEVAMVNIEALISKIIPNLLDIVNEYGSVYELSYNRLSFEVCSGVLYLYTFGDWRILQWEIENERKRLDEENNRIDKEILEAENSMFKERVAKMTYSSPMRNIKYDYLHTLPDDNV